MKYYLEQMSRDYYQIVCEDGRQKCYLSGKRSGQYTWSVSYGHGVRYLYKTAVKKLQEVSK